VIRASGFGLGRVLAAADYRLVVVAVCLTIGGVAASVRRRQESYVGCGGLIVRRASVFSSRWRVAFFDARAAGLVVEQCFDDAYSWNVTVASGARSHQLLLDHERLQVLLSCWFSPLRPPGAERLADFE
jgi:hypothetical protein